LAYAASEDRKLPVSLKADRVTFDQQKGFSTYEGHVILTQGSMRLEADRMTVQLGKNQKIEEINAYGAQPTFKKKWMMAPWSKVMASVYVICFPKVLCT